MTWVFLFSGDCWCGGGSDSHGTSAVEQWTRLGHEWERGTILVLTCFMHPLDGDKFKLRHELWWWYAIRLYASILVNSRSTSCICLNLKVWASSHLDVAGIEAWHSLAQRLARTLQHHHWHLPTLAHPGITLKLFSWVTTYQKCMSIYVDLE